MLVGTSEYMHTSYVRHAPHSTLHYPCHGVCHSVVDSPIQVADALLDIITSVRPVRTRTAVQRRCNRPIININERQATVGLQYSDAGSVVHLRSTQST